MIIVKDRKNIELEWQVTEILHEFGVPAHLKGYGYIREAIMMLVEDMEIAHSITKVLYYDIAKKHGTTVSKVERSIRNAVEVSWARGNIEAFEKYFGYSIAGGRRKPCNSEYMVQIADRIRLNSMAVKKRKRLIHYVFSLFCVLYIEILLNSTIYNGII